MFSLLPEREKKKLKKEYNLRVIVVALFFFLALGLISVALSIPSYLVSKSKNAEIANRIESVKKSTIFEESDEINKEITDVDLKIKVFENFDSNPRVYEIFEEIISKKNSGVRIRGMSFSSAKTDESGAKVSVIGVARDRESLRAFAKNLEDDDSFDKVELPVSNFTKETNLDFSVNITTEI